MPVVVRPAAHPSAPAHGQAVGSSPNDLLRLSCPREHAKSTYIVRTSFRDLPSTRSDAENTHDPIVIASNNGFVRAGWAAYAHHNHLRIRPEDVWFAILTQFSFYVNAHAEELRSHFVAHEGQKPLEVEEYGTIRTVDFGRLAVAMTKEIEKKLVDPELCQWILPDFTTTDEIVDTTTAAVLMMGTMQAYFTYTMSCIECGIPSVTLLGERTDWVKLRQRVDKLPEFGREPERWASLLVPVLDMFVLCFDEPESPAVTDFWARIADYEAGSGFSRLSGWITAFCFWDAEGKCKARAEPEGQAIEVRSIEETKFPSIDGDVLPDAFVAVPVKVLEKDVLGIVLAEYSTRMVAGSVGIQVTCSGELLDEDISYSRRGVRMNQDGKIVPSPPIEPKVGDRTGRDTLQPLTGWWMYMLKDEPKGCN